MQAKTLATYINQKSWLTVIAILTFAFLTALASRVAIHIGLVPITMQTLTVVLAGLVLGSRAGALSQLAYLGLIATSLPVDASAVGLIAFSGPTAGYLIGFVPAAFVTGWLTEQFAMQRWWGHFLAATVGAFTIYLFGLPWLALYHLGGNWSAAWAVGVQPFILPDLAKAVLAASLAEGGKYWLNRPQG